MRILVADDDPDILRIIGVNLKLLGHSVLESADGEHAIQVAAHERPDLIVLDVGMPYRDGLSILRELALLPETTDIPVVLISGRAEIEDQLAGWQTGAADYLTKPFAPYDLASAIERIMEMSPKERRARRDGNLALMDGLIGFHERPEGLPTPS